MMEPNTIGNGNGGELRNFFEMYITTPGYLDILNLESCVLSRGVWIRSPPKMITFPDGHFIQTNGDNAKAPGAQAIFTYVSEMTGDNVRFELCASHLGNSSYSITYNKKLYEITYKEKKYSNTSFFLDLVIKPIWKT